MGNPPRVPSGAAEPKPANLVTVWANNPVCGNAFTEATSRCEASSTGQVFAASGLARSSALPRSAQRFPGRRCLPIVSRGRIRAGLLSFRSVPIWSDSVRALWRPGIGPATPARRGRPLGRAFRPQPTAWRFVMPSSTTRRGRSVSTWDHVAIALCLQVTAGLPRILSVEALSA